MGKLTATTVKAALKQPERGCNRFSHGMSGFHHSGHSAPSNDRLHVRPRFTLVS
jgi:hypothetical protein